MHDSAISIYITAAILSFIPAILWLVFWHTEDTLHEEPKRMNIFAFLAGMLAVVVAIGIESKIAHDIAPIVGQCSFFLWFLYALAEEGSKFALCFIAVLWTKSNKKPIDPVLFLISTALGFAALENGFFAISAYMGSADAISGFTAIIGSSFSRFFGASLLHVLSSAVVGISMSYTFYKKRFTKLEAIGGGLLVASLIHAFFNFFIASNKVVAACANEISASTHFLTYAAVWIALVIVILILEHIKLIVRPRK